MAIAANLLASWGANIRAAREAAGFTQAALAAAVGVAESTWWRWEQGRIPPSDEHKAAIAVELSADARDLFPLT